MLKNIYPYLRCARYLAVYYDSTDDEAADLINQANSLIREGKYTEAIGHMDTVKEDVRSYNTMGAPSETLKGTVRVEGIVKDR